MSVDQNDLDLLASLQQVLAGGGAGSADASPQGSTEGAPGNEPDAPEDAAKEESALTRELRRCEQLLNTPYEPRRP